MSWDYGVPVRIECADMAKMNKIRAWARRNNATVHASPYTKGAWEGFVKVHSSQMEGRTQHEARIAACKEIIGK